MDYQKAYAILFNGITDALAALDKAKDKNPELVAAELILQGVQRQTESMYMEAPERQCAPRIPSRLTLYLARCGTAPRKG